MADIQDVLSNRRQWAIVQGDCIERLREMPEDSVDLCFWSPPYRLARTYGINFSLADQSWVDWMVQVFTECRRVCKGLVAAVVEGQTKKFRWTAEPALLLADLHRAGFNLRKPPIFHRVGIPGSGGPDWLRNDWEWIICTTRPGKLPWSDNTAMGHAPKWAPGGAMSYRNKDGARKNSRGYSANKRRLERGNEKGSIGRRVTRGSKNGDTQNSDSYYPPTLANPGNVISCKVGGGLMGAAEAHENEAPFPESLCEFFVRSFCPPGGICLDPFSGSGTTVATALKWNRRGIGIDIRESQVELGRKRVQKITPMELLA